MAVRVTPGIDNCLEDQEKEALSNNVEEMVLIKSIQRPQAKKLSRMYLLIKDHEDVILICVVFALQTYNVINYYQ